MKDCGASSAGGEKERVLPGAAEGTSPATPSSGPGRPLLDSEFRTEDSSGCSGTELAVMCNRSRGKHSEGHRPGGAVTRTSGSPTGRPSRTPWRAGP